MCSPRQESAVGVCGSSSERISAYSRPSHAYSCRRRRSPMHARAHPCGDGDVLSTPSAVAPREEARAPSDCKPSCAAYMPTLASHSASTAVAPTEASSSTGLRPPPMLRRALSSSRASAVRLYRRRQPSAVPTSSWSGPSASRHARPPGTRCSGGSSDSCEKARHRSGIVAALPRQLARRICREKSPSVLCKSAPRARTKRYETCSRRSRRCWRPPRRICTSSRWATGAWTIRVSASLPPACRPSPLTCIPPLL